MKKEDVDAMTPEQKRVKIASTRGWKQYGGWWVHPNEVSDFKAGRAISFMPDYLNDLNSMREVVKSLPFLGFEQFILHLVHLHGYKDAEVNSNDRDCGFPDSAGDIGELVTSTAVQFADAFLLTI